jgi:2-keto-4-pentenoate hydratase/2-oxohepta-3-ene-1,7-dioic acid hydratase in catechol pathway
MQLFSYLSEGKTHFAYLAHGNIGIDLQNAYKYFRSKDISSSIQAEFIPNSIIDIISQNEDGKRTFRMVVDWILSTITEFDSDYRQNRVIFDFAQVALLPPIPVPGKIICIAGNFPAPGKIEKPDYPIVFLKPSSGVIGHMSPIIIPQVAKNTVYEVELAVVIGKSGKNIPQNKVDSFIAGYTLANDLGDRLLEKRTSQWTSGKMFDTFTPMGPILTSADELADSTNLKMFTKVNDQLVQKGNTSQMFFNIPFLIRYLSTLTTLEPGDVILTGSPKLMDGEPNPLCELGNGDLIEIGIEKLGSLMNPVTIKTEVV